MKEVKPRKEPPKKRNSRERPGSSVPGVSKELQRMHKTAGETFEEVLAVPSSLGHKVSLKSIWVLVIASNICHVSFDILLILHWMALPQCCAANRFPASSCRIQKSILTVQYV